MNQRNRFLQTLTLMMASALAAVTMTTCQREAPASPSPAETGSASPAADSQHSVRTEKVAVTSFRRTIETTGTVAFDQNRSTQVLSPISGPLSRILVAIGSRVSRDEPLAIVASPDFAADVSALRKAEATARNTRRIADLDRDLFKNDAISRRDMEQAETDAVSAEADRDAAIQQLRALGVDEKTMSDIEHNLPVANQGGIIRSPLAGTVVEKFITPGQLLQASTTPCFTVADLSSVWVMANVFEADLPFVAAGDSAEIITGSGQPPLEGKVEYIAALVDPNTRAVLVRLGVPNPGGVLKRDLYVRVAIHSHAESKGLLVPVSAVLRDEENLPFIFVARTDGTFARRRVQIGARIGDRQEITSGLAAGDSIVVEGGLFLGTVEHS